jgi:hypothetical protein
LRALLKETRLGSRNAGSETNSSGLTMNKPGPRLPNVKPLLLPKLPERRHRRKRESGLSGMLGTPATVSWPICEYRPQPMKGDGVRWKITPAIKPLTNSGRP